MLAWLLLGSVNFIFAQQPEAKSAGISAYNQYSMTIAGIKNSTEVSKVLEAFKPKTGIVYTYIEPKTFTLQVITEKHITFENVADILRIVGCKTDTYSEKKLDQKQVDEFIKAHAF